MGMSLERYNARALREAEARRRRDGADANDKALDDYEALAPDSPRREQLTRVIGMLSMM